MNDESRNRDEEPMKQTLRQEALSRLREQRPDLAEMDDRELAAMVHELEVQGVELEIQNEELRQAQVALAEVRDRYRELYERAPVGYVACDQRGVIQEVNLAASRICGRPRGDLVGQRLETLVAGADREALYLHLRRAHQRTGEPRTCELRLDPRDDAVAWVLIETVAVAPGGYRVTLSDVSVRKQVELALAESEARYRKIVEGTHEGIWILDRDGASRWVNERLAIILGYPVESFEGRSFFDFLRAEDREHAERDWRERREDRGGGRAEFRFRHRDGHPVWLAISSSALRDASGQIEGILCMLADVTEQRQAREALRTQEERLRLLLEHSRDGIHLFDIATGRYTFMSPAQAELTGFSIDELVGQTREETLRRLHPDDHEPVLQYLQAVVDGESPAQPMEYRWRVKSGEYRWFSDSRRLIRGPDGEPASLVGVSRDVTRRKEVEFALHELNATLEQRVADRTEEVQRQADQLRALALQLSRTEQRERRRLARILHDHIQQLIVAARIQLDSLAPDDDPERVRSVVDAARATLREALQSSRSLTIDLSPPVLHQAGLVPALNWLAQRMLEHHQLVVTVQADEGAEPASEEVRGLLFECTRELLFNVVKHAETDDVEVELTRPDEGTLEIAVRDHGRGFDPSLLARRNADDTTFGLFSIQQRLSHLGGAMHLESAPDMGTAVTLRVPFVAVVAETSAGGPAELDPGGMAAIGEPTAQAASLGHHRILIVDDHAIMREGLVTMLDAEADLEIVGEAADGPTAIDLAAELHPDVVVMDVNLGVMNGVEATRRIRQAAPDIRVVGLSMHEDSDVARAMREAGACAYLTKGGPTEDLLAAIRADAIGH